MILLFGLINTIIWCFLWIFVLRNFGGNGGIVTKRNLLYPFFTFIIPVCILVTNLIGFFIWPISISDVYDVIQFIFINGVPLLAIFLNLIKEQKLKQVKYRTEEASNEANKQLEDWLIELKNYKDDIKLDFYTYDVDGKLGGTIIARYKLDSSKEALLRSKNKLPPGIDLKIKKLSVK